MLKEILMEEAKKFQNNWKDPICDIHTSKTISIIIPVYHPEHLEEVLKHLESIGGYEEIILVDDSGMFQKEDFSYAVEMEHVTILYHEQNLGRPSARNTGASFAKGDILIFMDQDMFLDPEFINQAKKYYHVNDSLVFLGLRDTVPFENIPDTGHWSRETVCKDWRIETKVMPHFMDLTVLNVGSAYNRCCPNEIIQIAKESRNLRELGINKEKTFGFWDLPSMVVSHSMIITKKDYFRIGGFPEWIQGWGGEDIVLGFLACAAHIPVYLSECFSYQAAHDPYSGSEEAKIRELERNITYYRTWASTIDEFPVLDLEQITRRRYLHEKII